MDKDIKIVFSVLMAAMLLTGLALRVFPLFFKSEKLTPTLDNISQRLKSWWIMIAIFAVAVLTGGTGSVIMFSLTSFMALREYITLAPTDPRDNKVIFCLFFVVLPLQYYLVYSKWYGLFTIMIPVYCFLLIPILAIMAGKCENFMQRVGVMQWGVMACVYSVSHAPALLNLKLTNFDKTSACLLVFLVFIVEANDVFQYIWGKSFGKLKVAPTVSPNKTWFGFIGGVFSSAILGAVISILTPMNYWQAALLAALLSVMGFFGDLTMSAIKRDRGVKDFSAALPGHGGVLDRIDSLCFASPIFFHVIRFFYG